MFLPLKLWFFKTPPEVSPCVCAVETLNGAFVETVTPVVAFCEEQLRHRMNHLSLSVSPQHLGDVPERCEIKDKEIRIT